MEINNRIKELIRILANNKQSVFSKTTDIPKTTLNGIVSPPFNDPSFKSLRKILDAYPSINTQWLLYGKGTSVLTLEKTGGIREQREDQSNKNTEISERVSLIIQRLSPNPNSFATDLGYVKSQTIYDIINGKSAPSYDFFRRFMLSEYSGIISINWLLTGRGKMIIDTEVDGNLESSGDTTERAIFKMIRKVVADNALFEAKLEKLKKKKKKE